MEIISLKTKELIQLRVRTTEEYDLNDPNQVEAIATLAAFEATKDPYVSKKL